MKKTILLYLICNLAGHSVIFGQTDVDALRYSLPSAVNGTTRYSSMGGAFGALGGDFSCLAGNPAGIAIYRSSEFSMSPSIYVGSTESTYLNKTISDNRFNFNFGNIGLVYTNKLTNNEDGPGWKSVNFGFGYNRIDNFHNKSFYEAVNPVNSFTNYLAQQSEGIDAGNLDPYYESLAYNAYLINPDSPDVTHYFPAVSAGNVTQRRNVESRGSKGETDFTFGGNYGNKFFLGATLGFATLRYLEDVTYEEKDNNPADSLSQYSFDQNLTTHGSGFNFKVGVIYRPADWIRLGAAVHTPTWYTMHDEYINTMKSKFAKGTTYSYDSPAGTFDYDLTTPFQAMGSIALIFQQFGLLSADYERTDVSQARLNASGFPFSDVNDAIRKKYGAVNTFRVGAEWRFGNYSIRGGTALTSSPIQAEYRVTGSDFSKKSFSGGFGIRDEHMFIDLGYVYSTSNQFFQPYTLTDQVVPGAKNKVTTQSFNITFGVKF